MIPKLILVILCVCSINLCAQRILYERIPQYSIDGLKSLKFWDSEGSLIKRLDLDSLNPYLEKVALFKSNKASEFDRVFSEGLVSNITTEYVGITFVYHVSLEDEVSSQHSEARIFIYDKYGKLVRDIGLKKYAVSKPLISENNKYVAVSYSGFWERNENNGYGAGFNIYDIVTGRLVVQMNNLPRVGGFSDGNNTFLFSVPESSQHRELSLTLTTYYAFDGSMEKLYRRTFTYEERARIRRFSNKGCVLAYKQGDVTLLYDHDFQLINIASKK